MQLQLLVFRNNNIWPLMFISMHNSCIQHFATKESYFATKLQHKKCLASIFKERLAWVQSCFMSNISHPQIFDDIFIYLRFCVFVRLQCVFSWGGLVMAGPLGRGCFSGGGGRFITGQLMSSRSSIS